MPPLQHQHTRHTSSLQLHPHTHHIVTPGFVDRPRRSDCTAGQMDGEAGWWTTCGNIGLPPLARVMGVGRQQQQTHPSPLCPLCNIHTHDTHHLFNCTHIRTTLSPLDLWTDPAGVTALLARWAEKLAGGPQAGTLDSPTSKGHGSA